MAAAKKGTVIFNTANAGITGKKFGIEKLTCDYNAVGRKYKVELHGDWTDLDAVAKLIVGDSTTAGNQNLKTLLANMDTTLAAIIPDTGVICRTPQLNTEKGATFSTLTVIAEEGLQEGGKFVGGAMDDSAALLASGYVLPADTTFRFVWEPNDVELLYGLPFRPEYKWDLTNDLKSFDFPANSQLPHGVPYDNPSATDNQPGFATNIDDLVAALGYDPDTMTEAALCNIWREGGITEPQRGAIYQYLIASGSGTGTFEYAERILRGETSYRYWIPHVSVIRRYRTPPDTSAYPSPGASGGAYDTNGPPLWTDAPDFDAWDNDYIYLCTGPQVEFSGEFWTVECQWSGFLDFDSDLYGNPSA